MPESLRGDGSSAEQHSVAANRERQTRYDELSEIKVKANWPLKEPADRHQLARSSTATLLMGDVPPTPSTPAPRKSKLIEVRDEEVSAPPMPTGPVPRKSMLPDDAEAFVHKEEDEVEKVDDIKKDAPPPPPPPPPPNSLLVVDQPSVSEFAAGTRVLALYSQDELFYEATVVEKVAEGENSYVVVFDGYGAEEVSTDVRDIDASLSEFDVNSDGEEGAIGHEEVLMRKDSVMKDLIKTLSARKMHTLGSGVDNEEGIAVSHAPSAAAPTTNVLVNPDGSAQAPASSAGAAAEKGEGALVDNILTKIYIYLQQQNTIELIEYNNSYASRVLYPVSPLLYCTGVKSFLINTIS